MPHRKRRVKKEALGSRRTKNKKAGRKFSQLYAHLAPHIEQTTRVPRLGGRQ